MFTTNFDVFLDIFWPKSIASRDGCVLLKEGTNSLLGHECVLSVIVQLSNKNTAHPQCAFGDSGNPVCCQASW